MEITNENYFSPAVEQAYFTNSQIKNYMKCPAYWQAKRTGFFEEPEQDYKSPLLQGTYVDMALTEPENFPQWCMDNADKLMGRNKKPYTVFNTLDKVIARLRKDEYFMSHLEGSQQEIIQLEDFHGFKFKCKLDALNYDNMWLTDLKTTGNEMHSEQWTETKEGEFVKVHWIASWKYPMQLGLYREAVFEKHGFRPHPYIAATEKKEVPNFEVFDLMANPGDEMILRSEVQRGIDTMAFMADDIDKEPIELEKCGRCQYCLTIKKLFRPVAFKYDPRMLEF